MPVAFKDRLLSVFALDLRTLALFRFALGTLVSIDLWRRLADVRAFYSDEGVLPRAFLLSGPSDYFWSLGYVSGSVLFQSALLIVGALAAAAFAWGYRTRSALLVTWAVVVSFHFRNPQVLIGGDSLMACLLFWSFFLPLAARWSVDAALSTTPPPGEAAHRSWASAALLLQVLSVYFFTAVFKHDPAWWPEGTAVYYALELDRYALPLGQWLNQFPQITQFLTYAVYFLEWIAPILALSPWATQTLRHGVFVALALMHIGFLLTLAIGHFPWASLVSLTVLLGPGLWQRLAAREAGPRPLRIYYDQDCGFCLKSCLILRQLLILPPNTVIEPAQGNARARALMESEWSWVVLDPQDAAHLKWQAFVALIAHSRLLGWAHRFFALELWQRPGTAVYDWVAEHRGAVARATSPLMQRREERFLAPRWAQAICGVLLVTTLAWNLSSVGWLPRQVMTGLLPLYRPLRIDQSWAMFAPKPMVDDGWFVVPGQLEDGRSVNLLTGGVGPVSYDKPRSVALSFENIRWSSYLGRLWLARYAEHREPYARYLCREWNRGARPGERLATLQIEYMLEVTQPRGVPQTVERRVLWRHQCLPGAAPAEPEAGASLDDDPSP